MTPSNRVGRLALLANVLAAPASARAQDPPPAAATRHPVARPGEGI